MGSKSIFRNLEEARRFLIENDWENTSDRKLAKKIGCAGSVIRQYRFKVGFFRREAKALKEIQIAVKEFQRLEKAIQKTIMRNKLQKEMKLKLKEKYGIFKIYIKDKDETTCNKKHTT